MKKVSFSLATTESYKDKEGNRVDQTEWHNVVLWRGLADVAEKYLNKGSQVYIEGKIKTRAWDDKDGNKRYTTEIYADNMTMLGSKRDQNKGGDQVAGSSPVDDAPAPEDDLPF